MPLVAGAEARSTPAGIDRSSRGPRGTPQMQHTRIAHHFGSAFMSLPQKQLPDWSKSQICLFPGSAEGAPANRREPAREILPLQGIGRGPNMVPGE